MGRLADGSNVRLSGLSLRVVAVVITMVLLVACSAVTCLAGMHEGAGVDARSQSHAIASAGHLPHEHAFDASAPDLLSGEGPAPRLNGPESAALLFQQIQGVGERVIEHSLEGHHRVGDGMEAIGGDNKGLGFGHDKKTFRRPTRTQRVACKI